MLDTDRREIAESQFERNQRREAEVENALKQERARHEAAVKRYVWREMQNQPVAQCPLLILRNGMTGNRLDSPDHETMVTLINYRFSPSNNRARGD
jgi:hypothetical protein